MKKRLTGLFAGMLLFACSCLTVFATETTETATEPTQEQADAYLYESIDVFGETIQKERTHIAGYELPEEVNHYINEVNEDTLYLIESLSINGATDEFYLFAENDAYCSIPYNYVNMFKNNLTPFYIFLSKGNETVGKIYTNGVTMADGSFPLHVYLSHGADFIQISFDSECSKMEGYFVLSIPCDFLYYNYDIYEGKEVVYSNVLSDSTLDLHLSNFNTKTIKFYKPEVEETQSKDSIATTISKENVAQTTPEPTRETEGNEVMTRLIIAIAVVVVLTTILIAIVGLIKKRKK